MKRLVSIVPILLLLPWTILAQPTAKTVVTGVLVTPTGDLLMGSCKFQASQAFSTGGQYITGTPVVVNFVAGQLRVALYPSPTNWYYSVSCSAPLQQLNGRTVGPYTWARPGYWIVPASGTPLDISAVEISVVNPPAWPAGPPGTGGTNGNTILNGTAAPPSNSLGVNGDFYLNTSTECIYGPKASGAWPGSCSTLIGPTGAAGSTGGTGSTGAAGTSILTGAGAPGSGTGNDGDLYINTSTTCLYGPKASGAWPGICVSLIGPTGSAGSTGAAGSSVLNGTGAPSNGSGNNGDFYLNTANTCLYGPKASGAWPGSCTSLIGLTGPAGSAGAAGSTGAAGTSILTGSGAPSSGTGNNGDLYIDTAATCLYGAKTSGSWPGSCTSLIGPTGPAGSTGSTGAAGTNGNTILNGTSGPSSGQGVNGDFFLRTDTSCIYGPKASGVWPGSCTSIIGPTGPTGSSGAAGTNGSTILNGTGAPSNGSGNNGDFYVNTSNSCFYGPKASGAWPGSCTSLIGPTGPAGSTGPAGTAGTNGTNGNTVLNGTGAPSSGTGNNGDFYLRTDTNCMYGPKASGSWPGSCVSVVGPTGQGYTDFGSWNSITSYPAYAVVSYQGAGYRALAPNFNVIPGTDPTKWLLWAAPGSQGPPGVSATPAWTVVPFSTTPTFNATTVLQGFQITLTAPVTSSTITGTLNQGQDITTKICQDGVGGRTFVPPSGVVGFGTIDLTANACSTQSFRYDATNVLVAITKMRSDNASPPNLSEINGIYPLPATPQALVGTNDSRLVLPTGTPNQIVATDPSGSSSHSAALRAMVDLDIPAGIMRATDSRASGLSTTLTTHAPTGFLQTIVEPVQSTLPSVGNFQTAVGRDVFLGGLFNPANYGNIGGRFFRTNILGGGRNAPDNSDKKSTFGDYIWNNFNGSGQKYGHENVTVCRGAGDCYGYNANMSYDNRVTASGDEGITAVSAGMIQRDHLVKQTTTSLNLSTCAITALAGSVAKSTSPTDLKTVSVTGSTAACNIADWLTIDQGIFNSTDTNAEVIQIVSKTSSTITALFQAAHASSAPVAPSPVLGVSGNEWGQDAIIVDLSGTSYSTGIAYPVANGSTAFVGSGTTWKTGHPNGPIGGDVNMPGCIAFTNEDFSAYFTFAGANGPVRWWYPIQSFTDDTHGVMGIPYPGSLPATGAPYIMRPCAVNSSNQLSYGSSSESITGLVLRANAFPWTSGHLVENTISPYAFIYHGIHIPWYHWGPIAQAPNMLLIDNLGYAEAKSGVYIHDAGNFDNVTTFAYSTAINLTSSTRNQNLVLGGRSGNGTGIQLLTSSSPDDFHQICWGNVYTACIWPSGDGFTIAPQNASKLKLSDSSHNFGPTFDFTPSASAFVSNTITIPSASGTMALQVGGYMTRTIPATVNDEVDVGSFVLNANEANFDAYVSTANNTTHRYVFAISYTGDDTWRTVAPLSSSGGYATYDYALDVRSRAAGAYELRLRKTVGSGTSTAQVTVAGNPPGTFTPSTSTASVSAPTAWWGSSVLGELANKATLTNATGFSATLDPTNLTAARTFTLPDANSNPVQGIANPSDTNVVNYISTDGVQHRIAQTGGGGGPTTNQNVRSFGVDIPNPSGTQTSCIYVKQTGTINSATIFADTSISGTIDIKTVARGSYTGPASASSITASAKPTLSSATENQDTTLTGWTTSLAGDQMVCFVSTITAGSPGEIGVVINYAAN